MHAAETFTTGASGIAHWKLGNVDKKLVTRLAIPGMIGGALGAYVLSNIDGATIKPFIAAYLLVMGLFILWQALRNVVAEREPPSNVPARTRRRLCRFDRRRRLGTHRHVDADRPGNDAALRHRLRQPVRILRHADDSGTFLFTIGLELWPIITGLIVGGVVAAPFAALATKHLPDKPLNDHCRLCRRTAEFADYSHCVALSKHVAPAAELA